MVSLHPAGEEGSSGGGGGGSVGFLVTDPRIQQQQQLGGMAALPGLVVSTTTAGGGGGSPASEDPSKKIRKPYTITKSRESWTEQEHDKFLEALQLFDRDWKKIEAFVGSKTVIQVLLSCSKPTKRREKQTDYSILFAYQGPAAA